MTVVYQFGIQELDVSVRDRLIFFCNAALEEIHQASEVIVMQLLSYSFACHVGCKVKYFGKVVNVVRIRGEDNIVSCVSQHFLSMSPTSYQLRIVVDCEHNR